MSVVSRVKTSTAGLLCAALIVTSPGLEAWAATIRLIAPEGPAVSAAPLAGTSLAVPQASGITLPQIAAPLAAPVLAPAGAAVLPAAAAASAAPALGLPAAAAEAEAPPAAPAAAAAAENAGAAGPAAPASDAASPGEGEWRQGSQKFDGAGSAAGSIAEPVQPAAWTSPVPRNLQLKPADAKSLSEWMAAFHAKTASDFASEQFTKRDYYAWVGFLRFYTPSLGIKEAVVRGATYIYGDRLADPAQSSAFEAALGRAARTLVVSDPAHGKDAALARRLLALAEPPAQAIGDESSPYQVPVSALIPDAEASDLVMTATTLKRVEAASQAFALRDFSLLVGPPATEKSAIPKYLASQHKIPYLAVTMHPGIGTFELVGGYRPRVGRVGALDDSRAAIAARLAKDGASGDYAELLEAAALVYGAKPMADVLAAVRVDLGEEPLEGLASAERARRLTTLAYALEHGAQSLVWQDGYLSYAIKNDIWITFEELNAAPTETQEFLNEFMRSRRLAVTQKLGETEVISPRPGGRFMLWATMNPETDSNREVLAQTLKNRWRIKYFGHLPPMETAEIIEKKFGVPTVWALALVETFHRELDKQARKRTIGGAWRDGYEINLRQLLRTAKRWRAFVDEEAKKGPVPEARQRFLLAREAYSIYGGMMRSANERAGVYRMLDQALQLHAAGVRSADDLVVRPTVIEDLGDRLRIGDLTFEKGPGGPLVPRPSADYLADGVVLARLYEYAKALYFGEPLLLMGDTGAGKTSDLEYLFFRLNRNLRYKNLDSDTAIEEVIGGFAPGDRKGTFMFQEGMLPKAMEEPSGAFLDEFNLNPLVEWLNTVIDDGKLYLPHRIVSGRAMIVAAANPPDPRYPGRILLSAATRSRYTEIWVEDDSSPSRLSEFMSHWLNGGSALSLLLAIGAAFSALWFPAAGGSLALGSYKSKESPPWILLTVAATVFFFAAAATHFGNAIAFFAAIAAAWAGIILNDKAKRLNLALPLAKSDQADIRRLFLEARAKTSAAPNQTAWTKAELEKLVAEHHAQRLEGIRWLQSFPGSDDAAKLLERLALAETTAPNLIHAVKALGESEAAEAEPALLRLQAELPPDYRLHVDKALTAVRARKASAPQVTQIADLARSSNVSLRVEAALVRAETLSVALAAQGDLAARLRAQALTEKAAALKASGDADAQAILLRQLEDLLTPPSGSARGSAAAGGSWLGRLVDAVKRRFGSKKKPLKA